MPTITVVTRAGAMHRLDATPSRTVMETIRDAGLDELLALCGGSCSCATCHVFVEQGAESLAAIGDYENDLLDGSFHRTEASRLSCQLVIRPDLDGLRVQIAPED